MGGRRGGKERRSGGDEVMITSRGGFQEEEWSPLAHPVQESSRSEIKDYTCFE